MATNLIFYLFGMMLLAEIALKPRLDYIEKTRQLVLWYGIGLKRKYFKIF
jgi:hypothetical protein